MIGTRLQLKQRALSWILYCLSGMGKNLSKQAFTHDKHLQPATRRALKLAIRTIDEAYLCVTDDLQAMKEARRG